LKKFASDKMTGNINGWDKQKHEPGKSYALFCKYRDMGPFRSVAKLGKNMEESGEKNYSEKYLEELCTKWDWVKRAEAYDEYMEKIIRKKREEDIIEMTGRHADQSKDIQGEIYKSFKDPALKSEDIQKAGWVRNANVNSFVKAAKLERLSRGLPSDKIESDEKRDVKVEGNHHLKIDERRESLKEKMNRIVAGNDSNNPTD
jgi:hypothetical protein